jgi:hypothetical protein
MIVLLHSEPFQFRGEARHLRHGRCWSGFGLGLVWVWSGFGLGLVWVWSGFGLGLVWVWSGVGLGLVWVWCGLDVGLSLIWVGSGFGLGLIWVWPGFELGLVWVWPGFGLGTLTPIASSPSHQARAAFERQKKEVITMYPNVVIFSIKLPAWVWSWVWSLEKVWSAGFGLLDAPKPPPVPPHAHPPPMHIIW